MAKSHKFLALPIALLLFSACSGKKVDSEKVLESVVGAMCKRIIACQPNAMPSEDFCQNTMKTALNSSKDMPKVAATQKQLDACLDSINKGECSSLLGNEPPKDCEFLK